MVRPATGNSIDLDEALRARIMASAERLLNVMPVVAKKIAMKSVDLPEFMLNLARGIPAIQVDNPDIVEELGRTITFNSLRRPDQADGRSSSFWLGENRHPTAGVGSI